MRRFIYIFLISLPLLLSGCTPIGDKSTSMSIIYFATALLSLLLLIGYFILIRKKNVWFIFLFSSVFVVNTGYWLLSVCRTLNTVLFANRLAYLGSVFLPMAVMMIVLNVTHTNYKKWFPYLLSSISIVVFLVAASYPYLDIYYKDATLKIVDGVTVLCKTYGILHPLYLVFLLSYFGSMIGVIVHTFKNQKLRSRSQSIVLAIAVFVNISVWLLEQLVNIDFEFLSVSYIISELFLIGLYITIEEESNAPVPLPPQAAPPVTQDALSDENKLLFLSENLSRLTPTERKIYDFYLEGKSTKEIMALLTIKENTLKYHNKNIYSKLGVSSRKELLYFAKML